MSNKRKPDAFDRSLKALARAGRGRRGKKFLKELGRDHGHAIIGLLADQIGKP